MNSLKRPDSKTLWRTKSRRLAGGSWKNKTSCVAKRRPSFVSPIGVRLAFPADQEAGRYSPSRRSPSTPAFLFVRPTPGGGRIQRLPDLPKGRRDVGVFPCLSRRPGPSVETESRLGPRATRKSNLRPTPPGPSDCKSFLDNLSQRPVRTVNPSTHQDLSPTRARDAGFPPSSLPRTDFSLTPCPNPNSALHLGLNCVKSSARQPT